VKLLALDTATELCSAALWLEGRVLTREDLRPRASAMLILQMVQQLLVESGLALRQLDAIAFGRGPGAFTGVRLAAAVVQGLAFAAEIPLLPISDLRALAQQAFAQPGTPERALICQDARMAQVYWGCFERDGVAREAGAEAVSAPSALSLPQSWAGQSVCGAGSGFEAYPEVSIMAGRSLQPVLSHLRPRALEIAQLAAAEGLAKAVAPEAAQPVYLRDEVAALPSRN
jgi:tRNA threonylcarbamoyladenosine biosynthesis protein TsaB